jgi:hypothetical protein
MNENPIVKAQIGGFTFETTLDLFFLDNPSIANNRRVILDDLNTSSESYVYNYTDAYDIPCVLTLVKK